jgi:hypothetical protein
VQGEVASDTSSYEQKIISHTVQNRSCLGAVEVIIIYKAIAIIVYTIAALRARLGAVEVCQVHEAVAVIVEGIVAFIARLGAVQVIQVDESIAVVINRIIANFRVVVIVVTFAVGQQQHQRA